MRYERGRAVAVVTVLGHGDTYVDPVSGRSAGDVVLQACVARAVGPAVLGRGTRLVVRDRVYVGPRLGLHQHVDIRVLLGRRVRHVSATGDAAGCCRCRDREQRRRSEHGGCEAETGGAMQGVKQDGLP